MELVVPGTSATSLHQGSHQLGSPNNSEYVLRLSEALCNTFNGEKRQEGNKGQIARKVNYFSHLTYVINKQNKAKYAKWISFNFKPVCVQNELTNTFQCYHSKYEAYFSSWCSRSWGIWRTKCFETQCQWRASRARPEASTLTVSATIQNRSRHCTEPKI